MQNALKFPPQKAPLQRALQRCCALDFPSGHALFWPSFVTKAPVAHPASEQTSIRMPLIQVGSYSFSVSEPYMEGHRLTAAEAKALNSQRTERVRNIISKRLKTKFGGKLLLPQELLEFNSEAALVDRDFSFVAHASTQVQRNTLQGAIWDVALEAARERLLRTMDEPSDEQIEEAAKALLDDVNIISEGRRRFSAIQEVTKSALADLMG